MEDSEKEAGVHDEQFEEGKQDTRASKNYLSEHRLNGQTSRKANQNTQPAEEGQVGFMDGKRQSIQCS